MNRNSDIRVLSVDGHVLVRDALAFRLSAEPGICVVGCATNLEEAKREVSRLKPDIILMDVQLSGPSCFKALREMAELGILPLVVFIGSTFHDHFLDEALSMGVRGLVLKQDSPESLVGALKKVFSGEVYFSTEVATRVAQDVRGQHKVVRSGTQLSPREMQVLQHLAEGRAKKQIAELLGISVKTVEGHAQHLMKKLQIHNRVDLARYAIRQGLVTL